MNTENIAIEENSPSIHESLKVVPFKFETDNDDVYIAGSQLASDDEEIAKEAYDSLQSAYKILSQDVPESNILNDWPVDPETGELIVSGEHDFHIIHRSGGTYSDHNVLHMLASPSVENLMNHARGREFVEQQVITAVKRRAGGIMGSFLRNGEYELPSKLINWITGKDVASGGSANATRGSMKLFNAVTGEIAKTVRVMVTGVSVSKAEIRGLLSSKQVMMDKFKLSSREDGEAVEAKFSEATFNLAEHLMLAEAATANAKWANMPEVDAEGKAKPENAPYPVDSETGEVTRESLKQFFKPLDNWVKERDEVEDESIEFDFSAIGLEG